MDGHNLAVVNMKDLMVYPTVYNFDCLSIKRIQIQAVIASLIFSCLSTNGCQKLSYFVVSAVLRHMQHFLKIFLANNS